MIGIIGAMDTEIKALCDRMSSKEVIEINNLKFNRGVINGKDVTVVKSGVGKVNSALCAQLLAVKFNAEKIINTGIAGATGKGLGVFDFVVSESACYHDVDVRIFGYKKGQIPGCDAVFTADADMADKAVKAFEKSSFAKEHKIVKGRIASGDQFIADKKLKNAIIEDFNPMCVEMEGASIAHACTLNNVPFVIIRCLSDCADDTATGTYEFNEDTCARMCSDLVEKLIAEL